MTVLSFLFEVLLQTNVSGAFQIILDTFLAYFRPSSSMCHLVTQAWPPPNVTRQNIFDILNTYNNWPERSFFHPKKVTLHFWKHHLSFGDTVEIPPGPLPQVSRIIWMALHSHTANINDSKILIEFVLNP